MEYIINGNKPLAGIIEVSGAKNVALKLIIAALLTKGVSKFTNVPRIRDVESLIEIINFLGGKAEFIDQNTVIVENTLSKNEIPLELAAKTRVSFMLIAPLLYTFGETKIPNPGGCRLGTRPVDRLVMSLQNFGAEIKYISETGFYSASSGKPHPGVVKFNKKSHTGTELAIMYAAKIPGETRIENAALEPEIDDLIAYLNLAGAKITREKEAITIIGNKNLNGAELSVQSDRNEAVSYIILSSLFNGKIKIRNVEIEKITTFLEYFKKAGFEYQYSDKDKLFTVITAKKILPVNIVTAPHPGFMTDWQPMWALLMSRAFGESRIHETVFENRFGYVNELKKLGIKVNLYQPTVSNPEEVYQFNYQKNDCSLLQGIKINGPDKIHNAVVVMTDIRAGACLVMACLIAFGKSVVSGVEQVERGYENLPKKLIALGADIIVHKSL